MISKIIILGFVVLQVCCSLAQSNATDPLIPRDVLFELSDRKELIRLSPDAQTIFYVKGAYQPIPGSTIYCRHTAEIQAELSFDLPAAVGDYEVLNQSQLLVRTISREGQTVTLLDIENSTTTQVFPEPFRRIRWLAFSKNMEGAAFVAMPFDGNPFLFTYEFESGAMDTLSNVAQGHYPLFFDERLHVVAGERIDRDSGNKVLAYYNDGEWGQIASYSWSAERFLSPGLKSIVGVSSDGKEVYYTDNSNTDRTILKSFNIPAERTEIIVEQQSSDLMPTSFVADIDGEPVAIANHFSNRKWNVANADYESTFQYLQSVLEDFQVLDISADLNIWIIEEMNGGANITYLYDRSRRMLQTLFSDHEALDGFPVVNRFYNTVTSFDGLKLPIQYYLSQKFDADEDGLPDQAMPAIIYVHGGPWQGWMEDSWLITRHLQLLADRGYLVVYAQFRGSLTFGKRFLEAGNEQWGDAMMRDNVEIANWLAEERNVQQSNIGIFGWSYGGYAALAGAAFSPETYACAISLYGPTYLDAPREENAFGYSPNSLFRIADVTTEEGMALAHRHSPLYAADRIEIPVLLSTGAKDDRVPQLQMDSMADALHKNQKEVTYFIYPDEGHDYMAKESWTTFWSIAEPFLSKHLGGSAEPERDEDFSILNMKYSANQ